MYFQTALDGNPNLLADWEWKSSGGNKGRKKFKSPIRGLCLDWFCWSLFGWYFLELSFYMHSAFWLQIVSKQSNSIREQNRTGYILKSNKIQSMHNLHHQHN